MGKPAPTYWWDFDLKGDVIVQSDYPGGECLGRFAKPIDQTTPGMDKQIAQAEQLIADYEAGRKTPQWGVRL